MGAEFRTRPPEKIEVRRKRGRYGDFQHAVYVGNLKVTQWVRDEAKAEIERERVEKNYRPCMRCRSHFLSEGMHNRLCNNCRRACSDEGMI